MNCEGLSKDELREMIDELTERATSIEVQLAAKRPVALVSDSEWAQYREWRARALTAKAHIMREKRAARRALNSRPVASSDDVREISSAVIDALAISNDDEQCAAVYTAVRKVLDAWEDEAE